MVCKTTKKVLVTEDQDKTSEIGSITYITLQKSVRLSLIGHVLQSYILENDANTRNTSGKLLSQQEVKY